MSTLFHVDFKNKKLIDKTETIHPTEEVKGDVITASPSSLKVEKKTTPALSKEEYFERLMDSGMVQVFVDPRRRGVKLPAGFKTQPYVSLNWSHKFNLKDFSFDALGVRGTLSFAGTDFFVDLPWKSIWGMVIGASPKETFRLWKEDMPKDAPIEFAQE